MSVNKVNQSTGALSPIAGGTLYADEPIGAILPFGGGTAPSGFLLCNGAAISRTTYSSLFAVIGTSFGAGDGSTTFNVPDLRGEFLRGAGTNSHSGQGNGGSVGQHQDATGIDSFITEQTTHRLVAGYAAQNRPSIVNADTSTRSGLIGSAYHTVEQTITDVYEDRCFVRPTNTSVNYIIKAMNVALPSDFSDQVDDMIDAKIVNNLASGDMRAATSNTVYNCVTVAPTTEDITSCLNTDVATASGVNVTYFHNKQILIDFNNIVPKVAGNGKILLQNLPFNFAPPQAVSILAVDTSQSATDTHCVIYTNAYNNWLGAHLSGVGKHYYGQIISVIR